MTTWIRPTVDCKLVAKNDSATTYENKRIKIGILDNDLAGAGRPILLNTSGRIAKTGDVIAQKKTAYGILKLVLAADGTVVFDPGTALLALKAGQIFKTGFTYSVTDSLGQLSHAVVNVNVKGLNSGPLVSNFARSSDFAEAVDASAQDLPALTGFFRVSDRDRGDKLSAKIDGPAQLLYSGGALPPGLDVANLASGLNFKTAIATGTTTALGWSYDPPPVNLDFLKAGETLTVVFRVRVSDGKSLSPVQTLRFTVVGTNDVATITGNAAGSADENSVEPVGGTLQVKDLDRGESTFKAVNPADLKKGLGTFTFDHTTGAWTFKVDNAAAKSLQTGETATETLTVKSTDGTGTQGITVTIVGLNDASVITGDAAGTVTEDKDNDSDLAGVQSFVSGDLNATDVDSPATFTADTAKGKYGTLVIDANGQWTYTLDNALPEVDALNAGDHLTETFTATTADGTPQQIVITINGANDAPDAQNDPEAEGDTIQTPEDTAVVIDAIANDTDVDNDTLTIIDVQVDDPSNGTAAIIVKNGKTQIEFTPAANYNGPAVLHYTVSDGSGGTDTAQVNIVVTPVNDAPQAGDDGAAQNDAITTPEDTPLTIAPGVLLANDTDADSDTLTIQSVQDASHGTVALGGGQVVFTPDANYNGPASFTYTVSDGHGGTATATVFITVTPVNDAPSASDDAVTTAEDTAIVLGLNDFGSYADVEGTALAAVKITTLASNGSLQFFNGTWVAVTFNQEISRADILAGKLRFVPDPDETGSPYATIGFKVSDGTDFSTSAYTLTVTVTPVNDAPVVQADKHVWVPSNPAEAASEYSAGYPLGITAPSDPDTATLTITVKQVPGTGQVGYYDGIDFVPVQLNATLSTSILTSLVYRPSSDPADNPAGNIFKYEVTGGGDTVTQALTIHEVPAGRAPGQEVTISSDHSPLTSGNDAYASFVVTSQFAQGVAADISANTLVLKTDFQNTPVQEGFQAEDLNGPNVMHNELQITLTISRNGENYTFVVVSDERGAYLNNNGSADWTKITETVNGVQKDLWVNSVSYTDIKLVEGNTTLADWLSLNGVTPGDTWTIRYDDDVGGDDQARYVNVEYYFNDPGDPSTSVNGTAGPDLIYGTTHDDALAGGAGNDTIVGRAGNDLLTGGDGSDSFVFNAPTEGRDTITDFAAGDRLQFKASAFGVAVGQADATSFSSSASNAFSGSEKFHYNSLTGTLFYDADGPNGANPTEVTVLGTQYGLSASDLVFVL